MSTKESVLMTGSKGLIGELILDRLYNKYDFYLIDRLITTDQDRNYFEVDISNYSRLEDVFKRIPKINYVIHLAGDCHPQTPWASALNNNIHGTWNIYAAAKEKRVERIVFASSNHVTGMYEYVNGSAIPNLHEQSNPQLITTSDPPRPDGPYGISKLTGEAIARFYFDKYMIESVCLRIGSVIKNDSPVDRQRSTWLSHNDLIQLITCSLKPSNLFPGFGIYYAVSNNKNRFWDIAAAERDLGFSPVDRA